MSYGQALDTLGNTKWRVNKKVLTVVEALWARGGNIAGLVDREDVRTYTFMFEKKVYMLKLERHLFILLLAIFDCYFCNNSPNRTTKMNFSADACF